MINVQFCHYKYQCFSLFYFSEINKSRFSTIDFFKFRDYRLVLKQQKKLIRNWIISELPVGANEMKLLWSHLLFSRHQLHLAAAFFITILLIFHQKLLALFTVIDSLRLNIFSDESTKYNGSRNTSSISLRFNHPASVYYRI